MTRPISWTNARPLRRWRIFFGILLVIAAVAFAVYGLLSTYLGRPHPGADAVPTQATSDAPVPARPAPAHSSEKQGAAIDGLPPIAATPNPKAFATNVARALFDWDTTAGHSLADYRGRLLAVADPSGLESPGLVSDLTAYLPSQETWEFLGEYGTRQHISLTAVSVPAQWRDAQEAARPDELAPGTAALTVSGSRIRSGMWEGEPVAENFDVAFTVFVVCEPTYPRCFLLRLSRLDEPLR